jgi:hypothetical protein
MSGVTLTISVDFFINLFVDLVFNFTSIVWVSIVTLTCNINLEESALVLAHDWYRLFVLIVNLDLESLVFFLVEILQMFLGIIHIARLRFLLFWIIVESEVIEARILIVLIYRVDAFGAKRWTA